MRIRAGVLALVRAALILPVAFFFSNSLVFGNPALTPGVPWTGERGKSETVAEIMAREQKAGSLAAIAAVRSRPSPLISLRNKQRNPNALEAAQWPAPVEKTALSSLPQALNPQTVGTSFLAIQSTESGFVPPDPAGDVSPTQILVATNGRIKVFSKSGVLGGLNTSLETFFVSVRGGPARLIRVFATTGSPGGGS
ncbi:MAG: hypothetical protein L0196_07735 [candidate division Zixibacteria bacterium]|nr:hypothetical protein [candidate division Zixibacteria bacterium]